jgi:hypothetical protein
MTAPDDDFTPSSLIQALGVIADFREYVKDLREAWAEDAIKLRFAEIELRDTRARLYVAKREAEDRKTRLDEIAALVDHLVVERVSYHMDDDVGLDHLLSAIDEFLDGYGIDVMGRITP